MARRPVFLPQCDGALLVRTEFVEFEWSPGMAISQKQKSIAALHEAAIKQGLCSRLLEVSSKSPLVIGAELSAFNLSAQTTRFRRHFTVETAFQSSKVFEGGGPFRELLEVDSRTAKKDGRLQSSGRLCGFDFFGEKWPLEPKTAFYDWLYINTLNKNPLLLGAATSFDGFTDIEFNPERSINCQAYSLALYVALYKRRMIDQALSGRDAFLELVRSRPVSNSIEQSNVQPRLM